MWQVYTMKLTAFGILSSVVLSLIPKESYRKYVQLALGFLLLLLVLSPFLQLVSREDIVNRFFGTAKERMQELEQSDSYEEKETEYEMLLREFYENTIKEMGEEPWLGTENP